MNLKKTFKLGSLALATSLAFGAAAANAEVGYNAAVSSMYLWRGQDVSDGPAVSGGIDYSHESGFYASAWASSGLAGSVAVSDPDTAYGYELDLWLGYAGEVAGIGYDISYWDIDYPQVDADSGNEASLGLSYGDFSFSYTINTDSDSDYSYTTLGYAFDKFGITYGMSEDDGSDYTHVDFSYAATDSLSFTVSKASDDGAGVAEESLVVVSYSLPIGK